LSKTYGDPPEERATDVPLLSWADGGGKPAVYEHAFLENEKLSGSFISSENEELDIG